MLMIYGRFLPSSAKFRIAAYRGQFLTRLARIALYIDGPTLNSTARALGCDLDFKRLLHEFQSRGQVVRAYYYTAMFDDGKSSTLRPLVDWLDYNAYSVVTKTTGFSDGIGRRKNKLG